MLTESLRQMVLRQSTLFNQDLSEAKVQNLLFRERSVEIFLRDHTCVEQKFSKPGNLYPLMGHRSIAPLLIKTDIRHLKHLSGAGRDIKYIGDGDEGHL